MMNKKTGAKRQIVRQIVKAKQMCPATWKNAYDLDDVFSRLNVRSSNDKKQLLQFFNANRMEAGSMWWRMADFKRELIGRTIPERSKGTVLELLDKRKKLRDRRKMLWIEDPDHVKEIEQLRASEEQITREIESELAGQVLEITNTEIVDTFRNLGWDA